MKKPDILVEVEKNSSDIVEINRKLAEITSLSSFPRLTVETTDDGRLNRAIAYINSKGGGTLFVPTGIYTIKTTIELCNNISIKGNGVSSVFIIPVDSPGYLRASTKNNIICSDFKLKYETPITTNQNVHGLRFSWSTNAIVQRVLIENAPLSAIDFSSCTDVQVSNCYCIGGGQGNITATGTKGITIANNICKPGTTQNALLKAPTGIDVGEFSYDVTITGNVIYDCYYGIYLRDDVERLTCVSNSIKNCLRDGIAVVLETGTYSVTRGVISNNIIEEVARTGIDLRSTRNCIVANNTLKTIANNGIWILAFNEDLTVTGNNVSDAGYHGINNANANNVRTVISNNTCYHNGVSGLGYAGIYNKGDSRIVGNICHDDGTKTQSYGITQDGNTPTIDGNVCFGNITSQINIINGGARGVNQEGYAIKSLYDIDLNNQNLLNANSIQISGKKIYYGTAIPTTGTYYQGDIIFNKNAIAGGYVGWICTVSGTPGTWKGFGLIET